MSRRSWLRPGAFLLAGALALVPACASRQKGHWSDRDPDVRLDWLLTLYQGNLQGGTSCQDVRGAPVADCQRVVREVERLLLEFPDHDRALMAAALLAHDNGNRARAQQYLDQLAATRRIHPEATVLRARMAVEDGNLRLARNLLERDVLMAPDHPGLREALAAVQFLGGDYAGARGSLQLAQHLGAPPWRISFHYGVLDEAQGARAEARLHYMDALNQHPGFQPASARLLALQVAEDVEAIGR